MQNPPFLPSPVTTPSKNPSTNNSTRRLNIATVVIGANLAIEVQDEFTAVDCKLYHDSHWMGFDLALPRYQEEMIKTNLIALIHGLWPAVDTTMFRLKLVKSTYLDPDDDDGDDNDSTTICDDEGDGDGNINRASSSSTPTLLEPQRFCQVVLGVLEGESNGRPVYGDIVLGPRLPYDEANCKKPEHEHESLAMATMVRELMGALGRLTVRERKRLAEQTYVGSSIMPAVKKVKTEGGDLSRAIWID